METLKTTFSNFFFILKYSKIKTITKQDYMTDTSLENSLIAHFISLLFFSNGIIEDRGFK